MRLSSSPSVTALAHWRTITPKFSRLIDRMRGTPEERRSGAHAADVAKRGTRRMPGHFGLAAALYAFHVADRVPALWSTAASRIASRGDYASAARGAEEELPRLPPPPRGAACADARTQLLQLQEVRFMAAMWGRIEGYITEPRSSDVHRAVEHYASLFLCPAGDDYYRFPSAARAPRWNTKKVYAWR